MRYRGVQLCVLSRSFSVNGSRPALTTVVRFYSDAPNLKPPEGNDRRGAEAVKEKALTTLQSAAALGRQWAHSSSQALSSTLNSWWSQYEEFVGINEVREAQTKVTQAEADFMVSRSVVREAHVNVEALQLRLKEVRERLERVSREEPHYLELATIEHKLLQEDRRLRSAYELAEGSEREKFALFSAAVRESHEKERTRAERTKNWSVIGSVLGAIIGVMGSTYVNRVRLQELKSLLLEAQKGPENLQEALRVQATNHRTQQDELGSLINQMRLSLHNFTNNDKNTETTPQIPPNIVSLNFDSALQHLQEGQQLVQNSLNGLKLNLELVQNDVTIVKKVVSEHKVVAKPEKTKKVEILTGETLKEEIWVRNLEESQRNLHVKIRDSVVYNAVVVYTASALAVSVLYLLLRGATP
ncbi:mitochondrial potassium channel [Boleophthalmus pectinirostris]|uniref:mitochondrial potassium channel n=1 Tax=Boleophthalmus pectinirostris TaxID=150288 RepID=UPI000A1C4DD0|nr:mitochondrial potassium channel [Boleophthalmus pectinirostris]